MWGHPFVSQSCGEKQSGALRVRQRIPPYKKLYRINLFNNRSGTEEEAREIAFNLDIVPKNEADEQKYIGSHKTQKLKKNRFTDS